MSRMSDPLMPAFTTARQEMISPPSDLHEDPAAFDLRLVGGEVHTGRRALRFAGAVVEGRVVLGALDLVIHHEAVLEMHLLVGAEPVGAEELPVRGMVDREGPPLVVEADEVFLVDLVGRAGVDPGHGHVLPIQYRVVLGYSAAVPSAPAWKSSR